MRRGGVGATLVVALGCGGRCWVGWGCFSPVTSRVSPRQPSYFFLLRQKKVTKKKASHVRAASRCLALLAAFGTLANSLRSDNASVLIRTLLRCSARPNGGGIPHGSSASRTSPEWLVRFAHLAECWGCLIPLPSLLIMGTARRATTPDSLIPHSSLLTPHSSFLIPHPSLLIPHPSFLTPPSSLLTPHSSPLTPHSSPLTPPRHSGSKRRTQTSSFRAQSRNPCFPALQLGCCDFAQHDGIHQRWHTSRKNFVTAFCMARSGLDSCFLAAGSNCNIPFISPVP